MSIGSSASIFKKVGIWSSRSVEMFEEEIIGVNSESNRTKWAKMYSGNFSPQWLLCFGARVGGLIKFVFFLS